jgi:hypothetical protein
MRPNRVIERSAASRRRGWLACVLALGIAACGGDDLTRAEAGEDIGMSPAMSAAQGWSNRVTGGGSGHLPNGMIQNVRAQVEGWEGGAAEGSFAIHARFPPGQNELPFDVNFEWRADVDCLTISGGLAWMSGTVSYIRNQAFPGPLPFAEGDPVMAVVRDKNADPSLPPGFFGPAAVFGTADCRDTPDVPPLLPGVVINGVFTIHSN